MAHPTFSGIATTVHLCLLAATLCSTSNATIIRSANQQALRGSPVKVVYGVMTSGLPVYREKLLAQVETWANGLPQEGAFFSVAGAGASEADEAALVVDTNCPDNRNGLACKEGRLMEEGYARGGDWFVVLGEDNYVNTSRMEHALETATRKLGSSPAAMGIIGCGQGLNFCPEIDAVGGLCGGGGYAINRAALEVLFQQGKDAVRQEYAGFTGQFPGDMASSCALKRRGVSFVSMNGLLPNRVELRTEFRRIVQSQPLVVHYCTPDVMRWLQASMEGDAPDEVQSLEDAAFPRGCCCSWTPTDLLRCQMRTQISGGAFLHLSEGKGKAVSFKAYAARYVKEHTRELSSLKHSLKP